VNAKDKGDFIGKPPLKDRIGREWQTTMDNFLFYCFLPNMLPRLERRLDPCDYPWDGPDSNWYVVVLRQRDRSVLPFQSFRPSRTAQKVKPGSGLLTWHSRADI